MTIKPLPLSAALAAAALLTISACGGGGGGGSSNSSSGSPLNISGTAATGAAIAGGSVAVKCTTGTGTATTNADGTYTVTVANGVAPCLIQVTTADSQTLYSALQSGQTVANITPLTQMVVAAALQSDPATAFSSGVSGGTATSLSASNLTNAVTVVQNIASNLGLTLTGTNPLTTTLTAANDNVTGDTQDQQIDGLMSTLQNSGISLSALTSAVTTAATNNSSNASAAASATVTSLQSSAASEAPLAVSGLASCPVARTGGYYYAGPTDHALHKVVINFGSSTFTDGTGRNINSMEGYDYSNSAGFTVNQVKDTNDTGSSTYTPCAFQFTLLGSSFPVNVRISASGMAAYSVDDASSSTPFLTDAANTMGSGTAYDAGLIIPMQKKWTTANLPGTLYGAMFSKVKPGYIGLGTYAGGIYKNAYVKLAIASDATAKSWICTALDSCPASTATADSTYTVSEVSPGRFLLTDTGSGVETQIAFYKAPSGDVAAVGANTTTVASTALASNFMVLSSRISAFPAKAVNDTWSNWNWNIKNTSGGNITQQSKYNTFTTLSVDSATNSFVRSHSDGNTDTITRNFPLSGMIKRTNHSGTGKDFVGLTGLGWTVYVSAAPGGGSDTAGTLRGNNFLGISIAKQ